MPIKPTNQEEAFFAKQEMERKRKAVHEKAARRLAQEQEERMKPIRCPKCSAELSEIIYREQRVDRCEACGGVWLDAGELEALAMKEGGFLWGLRKVFHG